YYRLFAFFNGTTDRGRDNNPVLPLPTPEQVTQKNKIQTEVALATLSVFTPDPLSAAALSKPAQQAVATLRKQEAAIPIATTLVMQELPKPRPTHVLIRGNHAKKGDEVTPSTPARWHAFPKDAPLNRLGLARWLVDPDNP